MSTTQSCEIVQHFSALPTEPIATAAVPFATSTVPVATATLAAPAVYAASAPVVEYIATAPAVYASPAPVVEYTAPAQVMSYAAPAQVLMYLTLALAACAAPSCYRDRWLRFSPCRVLRLHMHLSWGTSRLYLQRTRHLYLSRSTLRCTSCVRYISGFSTYAAPAPAVEYITSAQSVSYAAPARVLSTLCQRLIATAIGGFGSLLVEPTVYTFTCGGIHRKGTIGIRGTCTCRGLHRPSTFSVCFTCTCRDIHRAGTISVRFTFANCGAHRANTSNVLRGGVLCVVVTCPTTSSCDKVWRAMLSCLSLFVDTFHSCYKVSITTLTHRQLLCSPRTVGNAPHQGACVDLEMKRKIVLHMRSSLYMSCLLPQSTSILGASACGLCRTCCYRCVFKCDVSSTNVARRMFRDSTNTGVLRARACSLCRTVCDCNRELNSFPVVLTVYTCTCGGVHRAGTSSLCCTCAWHGVPRAGTSSV